MLHVLTKRQYSEESQKTAKYCAEAGALFTHLSQFPEGEGQKVPDLCFFLYTSNNNSKNICVVEHILKNSNCAQVNLHFSETNASVDS